MGAETAVRFNIKLGISVCQLLDSDIQISRLCVAMQSVPSTEQNASTTVVNREQSDSTPPPPLNEQPLIPYYDVVQGCSGSPNTFAGLARVYTCSLKLHITADKRPCSRMREIKWEIEPRFAGVGGQGIFDPNVGRYVVVTETAFAGVRRRLVEWLRSELPGTQIKHGGTYVLDQKRITVPYNFQKKTIPTSVITSWVYNPERSKLGVPLAYSLAELDTIRQAASRVCVNSPEFRYFDFGGIIHALGVMLGVLSYQPDRCSSQFVGPDGVVLRGIGVPCLAANIGSNAVWLSRAADPEGKENTFVALCTAASMVKTTILTEHAPMTLAGKSESNSIKGMSLWQGVTRAINILGGLYAKHNAGAIFALALVSGVHKVVSVVGHSDEGGLIRDLLRNMNFASSYGVLPANCTNNLTLRTINANSPRDLHILTDRIALTSAAAVAHCDPMIVTKNGVYPTVLVDYALTQDEINAVKAVASTTPAPGTSPVEVPQPPSSSSDAQDVQSTTAHAVPVLTPEEQLRERYVAAGVAEEDIDYFIEAGIDVARAENLAMFDVNTDDYILPLDPSNTGYNLDNEGNLVEQEYPHSQGRVRREESHLCQLGSNMDRFATNYAKALARCLGLSAGDRDCDAVTAFLTARDIMLANCRGQYRHLAGPKVMPYFWIEPTGLLPHNAFETTAETYMNGSFGAGINGCRAEIPLFEHIHSIEPTSGAITQYVLRFSSARRNALIYWLDGHWKDGLKYMRFTNVSGAQFMNIKYDGGEAQLDHLIKKGGFGWDKLVWTRGQNPLPHPGEALNLNPGCVVRVAHPVANERGMCGIPPDKIPEMPTFDDLTSGFTKLHMVISVPTRIGDRRANHDTPKARDARYQAARALREAESFAYDLWARDNREISYSTTGVQLPFERPLPLHSRPIDITQGPAQSIRVRTTECLESASTTVTSHASVPLHVGLHMPLRNPALRQDNQSGRQHADQSGGSSVPSRVDALGVPMVPRGGSPVTSTPIPHAGIAVTPHPSSTPQQAPPSAGSVIEGGADGLDVRAPEV